MPGSEGRGSWPWVPSSLSACITWVGSFPSQPQHTQEYPGALPQDWLSPGPPPRAHNLPDSQPTLPVEAHVGSLGPLKLSLRHPSSPHTSTIPGNLPPPMPLHEDN